LVALIAFHNEKFYGFVIIILDKNLQKWSVRKFCIVLFLIWFIYKEWKNNGIFVTFVDKINNYYYFFIFLILCALMALILYYLIVEILVFIVVLFIARHYGFCRTFLDLRLGLRWGLMCQKQRCYFKQKIATIHHIKQREIQQADII
jgi:hypothetical protein